MPANASMHIGKMPRWLANVLLFGLVVYFAFVLANLSWLIAWQDQPVGPVSSVQASKAGTGVEGRRLASFDFFGRPPSSQPVADIIRETAPETHLGLRLEGVFVAQQPELSGAIVADTSGASAHYRIGDTLPGRAELVDVEATQILIKRDGAFETLTFDDGDSAELFAEEGNAATMSSDDFVAETKAKLDSQGPRALVAFGLQPVQDGATQGYVYDGSNAMLRAMNLQKGDVITLINGTPLGNFEQDRELLDNWRSQSQLEVEIERDGARFTVSYALPQ